MKGTKLAKRIGCEFWRAADEINMHRRTEHKFIFGHVARFF